MPYGHVAVVVATNASHVMVGEENWSSYPWRGMSQNYSRALRLLTVNGTTTGSAEVPVNVSLLDTDGFQIRGWMRSHHYHNPR